MTTDNSFDLFNAVRKIQENITEDDALLVICHDSKEGNLFMASDGELSLLSAVMSNENDYVNLCDDAEKYYHERIQNDILNIAINILRLNKSKATIFLDAANKFHND